MTREVSDLVMKRFFLSDIAPLGILPMFSLLFRKLTMWCKVTNLTLNTTKTKEFVMDLRKHKLDPAPLIINGDCMERIQSFKYLGGPHH